MQLEIPHLATAFFLSKQTAGDEKLKARLKIVRNVTVLNLCIGNNITDKFQGISELEALST